MSVTFAFIDLTGSPSLFGAQVQAKKYEARPMILQYTLCWHLGHVNQGHLHVIQFSHSSVKEFLEPKQLTESDRDVSRYHIRHQVAHLVLAQACHSEDQ